MSLAKGPMPFMGSKPQAKGSEPYISYANQSKVNSHRPIIGGRGGKGLGFGVVGLVGLGGLEGTLALGSRLSATCRRIL